jgi:ABC-type branched-subunit amino acid transport system substrate-binding protein
MGIISANNKLTDVMKGKALIITITTIYLILYLVFLSGPAAGQDEIRKHTATELDNYYSLSLKYDLSIEELKLANPGIINPRPGDVLIIPQKGTMKAKTEKGDCTISSKNKNEVYHVALMIPLSLELLADTLWKENLDPAKINELAPFRFIQFYHGFMMAADSLRKSGLQIEISVYDIDQQAAKAFEALRRPEMKKMDIIFGPFYKSTFSIVADFARENRITIINPLSVRNDILQGNPYVVKLIPSVESQPDMVAKLVRRDFSDHKVLFYVANKYQGSELVSQYIDAIEMGNTTGKPIVTLVDFSADSIQGFRNHASKIKPNLVIIYAENEVLPAALLGKLHEMNKDYRINIIGLPEWEKFTNIESAYLIALHANIFMTFYTDYSSAQVKSFILAYRAKYFDEPLNYAFSGFDAGYFFLGALMNYGRDFEKCLDLIRVPLIQNQFHFERNGDNGYDNLNWNVLQYFDYTLFKKSL